MTAESPPDPQEVRPRTRRRRDSNSWLFGIFLILLGVAFLLERSGEFLLTGNWWALFIYLASAASFASAWRAFRARGESGSATGSLVWGLVLAVVASILFFNLLWDRWWPAIIVAVGVGIVVGQLFDRRPQESEDAPAR